MRYWLLKSEPSSYSIDDLKHDGVGVWDDVRNYQARNFMRDDMRKGDMVLFYHSSASVLGIVGVAEVAKAAYPDPSQFDAFSYKYDPKSKRGSPRWVAVNVRFREKFSTPLTLHELKNDPRFRGMLVTKRGMRLSVQPVSRKHYNQVMKLRSKNKTKGL